MLLPLPLMLLIIGAAWRCCGLAVSKTGEDFYLRHGWLALLLLSLQPVADRLLRPIEAPIRHGIIRKNWTISWC
ncbi:hypothetical protein ACNKHU_05575 [Shigella flexneri]